MIKSPYYWGVQLKNKEGYTHASHGYTLQEALIKYKDVQKITFNPIGKKFPLVSFRYTPDKDVIFGVYTGRVIQEFSLLDGYNEERPPDKIHYQIIGWMSTKTNRRNVIGIDLDPNDSIHQKIVLQGE